MGKRFGDWAKEDVEIASRHMERSSVPLFIQKLKPQTIPLHTY